MCRKSAKKCCVVFLSIFKQKKLELFHFEWILHMEWNSVSCYVVLLGSAFTFRKMSYSKCFQFTAAVRGFHYYRSFWIPEPEQSLNCFHEERNLFDRFAIKICEKKEDKIVGHLPMEISRFTNFLLDRGARVSAKLSSTDYRRSPLVQGGIEIPCIVTVSMPGTIINQLLMERYRNIVETLYAELNKEEILGSFLASDEPNDIQTGPTTFKKKKKEKEISKAKNNNQKDIRKFFRPSPVVPAVDKADKKEKNANIITID